MRTEYKMEAEHLTTALKLPSVGILNRARLIDPSTGKIVNGSNVTLDRGVVRIMNPPEYKGKTGRHTIILKVGSKTGVVKVFEDPKEAEKQKAIFEEGKNAAGKAGLRPVTPIITTNHGHTFLVHEYIEGTKASDSEMQKLAGQIESAGNGVKVPKQTGHFIKDGLGHWHWKPY